MHVNMLDWSYKSSIQIYGFINCQLQCQFNCQVLNCRGLNVTLFFFELMVCLQSHRIGTLCRCVVALQTIRTLESIKLMTANLCILTINILGVVGNWGLYKCIGVSFWLLSFGMHIFSLFLSLYFVCCSCHLVFTVLCFSCH